MPEPQQGTQQEGFAVTAAFPLMGLFETLQVLCQGKWLVLVCLILQSWSGIMSGFLLWQERQELMDLGW